VILTRSLSSLGTPLPAVLARAMSNPRSKVFLNAPFVSLTVGRSGAA